MEPHFSIYIKVISSLNISQNHINSKTPFLPIPTLGGKWVLNMGLKCYETTHWHILHPPANAHICLLHAHISTHMPSSFFSFFPSFPGNTHSKVWSPPKRIQISYEKSEAMLCSEYLGSLKYTCWYLKSLGLMWSLKGDIWPYERCLCKQLHPFF